MVFLAFSAHLSQETGDIGKGKQDGRMARITGLGGEMHPNNFVEGSENGA